MAIEKVLIANNTSFIQDEEMKSQMRRTSLFSNSILSVVQGVQLNQMSCSGCQIGVSFYWPQEIWLQILYQNKKLIRLLVVAKTLPEFSNNPIVPKYSDIIIAKLGPGQEIELEAHAVKGMGKTHVKWSPVATAWYRMLPEVVLLQEVEGDKVEELMKKCPVNEFDIEDIGKVCRECIRGDEWEKFVALQRVKDNFIFTIDSTRTLPPEVLFAESVKILEDKCEGVITELL